MAEGEWETVRRVITAQRDGRSVFAIDEQVLPIVASGPNADHGQQLWQIWGSDGIPQLPDEARGDYADTLFAPAGGYRVQICEFPAESGSTLTPRGQWPALGTMLGRTDTGEVSNEFGDVDDRVMHYTDSVDLIIVMEGEVGVLLDGGGEVTLRKGDVLVQNGVPHAWRKGPVPCRIAMIAIGAERATS